MDKPTKLSDPRPTSEWRPIEAQTKTSQHEENLEGPGGKLLDDLTQAALRPARRLRRHTLGIRLRECCSKSLCAQAWPTHLPLLTRAAEASHQMQTLLETILCFGTPEPNGHVKCKQPYIDPPPQCAGVFVHACTPSRCVFIHNISCQQMKFVLSFADPIILTNPVGDDFVPDISWIVPLPTLFPPGVVHWVISCVWHATTENFST